MQLCKKDWSELPQDLLAKIFNHLQSRFDNCSFRAVCKIWHYSSSFHYFASSEHIILHQQLPTNIPNPNNSFLFKQPRRTLCLVANEVHLLRPLTHQPVDIPKLWLVSVEELTPGKLRFLLPLTKCSAMNLPQNFPKALNPSEVRLSLLAMGLKLCFDDGGEDVFDHPYKCAWDNYPCKSKVLFVSDDTKSIRDGKVMVLVVCRGGILGSLGLGTGEWTYIRYKGRGDTCFDDIVNFRDQICAIDRQGRAILIDGRMVTKVLVDHPVCDDDYASEFRKVLVESNGELYMVRQSGYNAKFQVYKLNERRQKWDEVNNLGNKIFVVSYSKCFFLDALEYPNCRGNCIVFPKKCFFSYNGRYYPHGGLFKRESKYLEIVVHYLDENRSKLISSFPGLYSLFWPPPSWILPSLSSTR